MDFFRNACDGRNNNDLYDGDGGEERFGGKHNRRQSRE
jgi:hypothetical protein